MERREKATEGLVQHGVCDSRGRASSRYIGMQAGSSVLRIKFGAKNSRHRTPPKKNRFEITDIDYHIPDSNSQL